MTGEVEAKHVPQDQDGPLQHPGVSTELDGEEAPSIHSQDGRSTISRGRRSSDLNDNDNDNDNDDTIAPIQNHATRNVSKVVQSRSSSTASRMTIVPRSARRGLLGRFTIVPEIERPHEYPRSTKWLITFFIAIAAAAAPMGSAIFYPALNAISVELNTTDTITNLSVALYMLSMAIFPLWWSSFSETLGRRTIYIVSFTLYTIFSILSAVSVNIGMLIVMRIFAGGSAASVQAVGAGTVADIWEVRERGRAMGIFYLGPLMGPLLAPIIGGALAEGLGWRSTQWFLAIYGGCLIIILTFCLPETLSTSRLPRSVIVAPDTPDQEKAIRPQLLIRTSTRQSVQQTAKKWSTMLHRWFIEPLSVLAYLRFPAVALTVYYASITFGTLYVLNISIQQSFEAAPYNFSEIIVGLLYIPNSLGYIFSSIVGGPWNDRIMHREARAANRYGPDGKLILIPEDRMRENAWIAAFVYPAALLWYGWTIDRHEYWLVPAVACFFFGLGSMIVFTCATTMLTEFMPKKSSSGVAVNNFVRNIFSATGGVVAAPLINKITNGWLFTGLAVICWASAFVIFALRRWGPKWRETMVAEMAKEN